MVFSYLLKVLRPPEHGYILFSGRLLNWYKGVYRSLLKYLLKTYDYYVINDSIIINVGIVKIVNEYRDLYFEAELERNGIEMTTHVHKLCIPIQWHKEGRKYLKSVFQFRSVLRVYIDGKELYVRENSEYTINTDVSTEIRCLMRDNLVKGLDVYSQSTKPIILSKNSPHLKKEPIFERESLIEPMRESSSELKRVHQPIRKKGFEIDTTF